MAEIYTRDIAADIVEEFEKTLMNAGIKVPSPEDDERDSDNCACLYGSIYYDLLDKTENMIIDKVFNYDPDFDELVTGRFSGKN